MKKLYWLLPLCLILTLGFRGGRFRGERTVAGDYYFRDSTTLNTVGIQGKTTLGDDAVFHGDITSDGFMTNARFQKIDSLPPDSINGYITFVFDDGHASFYDSVFPMFTDSGAVGVLALCSGTAGRFLGGDSSYTRPKEMHDASWEIASHSITHLISTRPKDSIDIELRESRDTFNLQGFDVKSFVYPGGVHNELIRRLTAKYYNCARATSGLGNAVATPPINTFYLPGWNFLHDSVTYRVRAQIDTAVIDQGWLIIMIHNIISTGDNKLSLDSVANVLSYAQQEDLEVVTLQEGLRYMGNTVEIGDSGRFMIGKNGKRRSFATIAGLTWDGGALTNTTAQNYYLSNTIDDTLITHTFHLPVQFAGRIVTIDSMILFVNPAAGDSIRVVLQSFGFGSVAGVDSICNVQSGNQYINILSNGSFTPVANKGYRLVARCKNASAANIKVGTRLGIWWEE